MKKPFSFTQCAAVVLLCTGLVSIGIATYIQQLTNKLEQETFLILKEFAAQDAQHLELQVKEDLALLSSVATALSVLPDLDKNELTKLLQEERAQNHYKNMEYATLDGIARLDDGTFLNLTHEPHFQKAIAGTPNISTRLQDLLDTSSILVEAVPVRRNDEIIGVLLGTISTADFARTLDMKSFGGNEYNYW